MEGKYFIAGDDAYTKYGVKFKKATYKELLKLPVKKQYISKNFPDQNGTKRLITPAFFESITYSIPVYHTGANETEFYENYAAFTQFILESDYFNFDVIEMNRRFVLLYQDMPSFEKLTMIKGDHAVYCESVITLVNDYPTLNIPVPPMTFQIFYGSSSGNVETELDVTSLHQIDWIGDIEMLITTEHRFFHIIIPEGMSIVSVTNVGALFPDITLLYVMQSSIEVGGIMREVYTMETSIPYSNNRTHLFELTT